MGNHLLLSRAAHLYQISQEHIWQPPGTEAPNFVTIQEVLLNCYQKDVIQRVRNFILSRFRVQDQISDEIPAQSKFLEAVIKSCKAVSSIDALSETAQHIGQHQKMLPPLQTAEKSGSRSRPVYRSH